MSSNSVCNHTPSQDYTHPDVHSLRMYDMTRGFKPFTVLSSFVASESL